MGRKTELGERVGGREEERKAVGGMRLKRVIQNHPEN